MSSNNDGNDVVMTDDVEMGVNDQKQNEPKLQHSHVAHPHKVTRTMTMPAAQMEAQLEAMEDAPSGEKMQLINEKDSKMFAIMIMAFQVFLIIIYAAQMDYAPLAANDMQYYAMFIHVSIMIFIGFGYLMTFLRRFGFSAVGLTLLTSVIVIQWSVPLQVWLEDAVDARGGRGDVVGIYEILNGLFCSAAVMISFGFVLGKITPTQLVVMGVLEAVFYWVNFALAGHKNHAYDVGGGMFIHLFGAMFGLTVARILDDQRTRNHKDNQSMVTSDLFSMVGSVFLWIFWPSFNAVIASRQDRAIVNTFISISASTVSAFVVSRLVTEGKFNIVHVQNSTLAGGVAMGVAADLDLNVGVVLLIGMVTGAVSVCGFQYLSPILTNKLKIQDICGAFNLHGLPGFISALVGIFAFAGGKNSDATSHDKQSGRQVVALLATLAFSVVGGALTAFAMKMVLQIRSIHPSNFFNDKAFWEIPSDYNVVVDDDDDKDQ